MTSTTSRPTDSLWLASAPATAYSSLVDDLEVDVAVIGGGIAGVSAALALKRDGARVALLERGVICGGATGLTTAKVSALQETRYSEIRRLHGDDTSAAYARASLAAVARIDELVHEEQLDCSWERVAAYTYAADAQQADAVDQEAGAARAAGLDVRMPSRVALPFDVVRTLALDDQGQLDPVRYVRGLAAAVDGDGSHVFESTAVSDVEEGTPCCVRTLSTSRRKFRGVLPDARP